MRNWQITLPLNISTINTGCTKKTPQFSLMMLMTTLGSLSNARRGKPYQESSQNFNDSPLCTSKETKPVMIFLEEMEKFCIDEPFQVLKIILILLTS